jgi:carbamoyl-phosphate synthase large subunit
VNLLFSCIGKRGYIADYFRPHLRPGEKIIGTSHTPWTPGFQACDFGLLLPPIASGEYVPAVIDTCRRHEIRGLLSFFDPDVFVLSPHVDELSAVGVIPLIPAAKAAAIGYDKWLTFQVLRAAQLTVPETVISLGGARAALRAGRLHFPLVVKPRMGYGSADVFVARNENQLAAFFSYAPDMIVQQFIDGDMYDVEALAGPDRRVLQSVAWRKYLSRLGETEQAVTVDDPELVQLGVKLAETVGLVGPMDADLIRTQDGTVFVLELNLRFGGGYPVSHLAGAGFPEIIVEILRCGRPEPRIGHYRPGVCLLKGLQIMGGPVKSFLLGLRSGNSGLASGIAHDATRTESDRSCPLGGENQG